MACLDFVCRRRGGGCGRSRVFTRARFLRCRTWLIRPFLRQAPGLRSARFELPFTDFESLRQVVTTPLDRKALPAKCRQICQERYGGAGFQYSRNRRGRKSLFKTGLDPHRATHRVKNNLYSVCCDEVSTRFRDFYRSFATVMERNSPSR